MKTPPQNFIVRGTVYPYDVMFSIGQTTKQLLKDANRFVPDMNNKNNSLAVSGTGRTIQTERNQLVVIIKDLPYAPQFHSTVAHEIFHAATMMLDRAGFKLEIMVSDEAYAYLIGWLTQEFYSNLKTKK